MVYQKPVFFWVGFFFVGGAFRPLKSHGFRLYSLRRSILHNFAQNCGRNGWVDRKIQFVKVESRKILRLKNQKIFIEIFIENPVEKNRSNFFDLIFSFSTEFSMKFSMRIFWFFRSRKFSRLNFDEFYFSIYSTDIFDFFLQIEVDFRGGFEMVARNC